MSRISHLPPRFPTTRSKGDEFSDLIRFPSLGTILEEQPSWLDDLLTDSDTNPKGTLHRRSASDSAANFEVPADLQCLSDPSDENSVLTISVPKSVEVRESSTSEICSGFEGSCVYGPNSPRQKDSLTNSEVSALMESIPPNKLQYVTVDFPADDTIKQSDLRGDFQVPAGDCDPDMTARRRSGQRSRVRKLQYIAELERSVEVYQTVGAELSAGVASLLQQRVALYMENKNLRRQIAGLQQEKLIKDGEYQSLKNEAERLKAIYGRHRRTKSTASCFEAGTAETGPSGTSWQMSDFGKLSLGGNSVVSLKNGFSR